VGRLAAKFRPRAPLRALPPPAPAQVADPRRGTTFVLAYGILAAVTVLAYGLARGFVVELSPLELIGYVALAAGAGQIAVLVGPRTWYTPTTPVVVLAGLIGGPIAGALTGVATDALGSNLVWRQRVMGASRSAAEGFAAGLVGLLPVEGTSHNVLRVAAAVTATFLLAQVTRTLVVYVRGIRPPLPAIRTGAMVDAVEAVIVIPVIAALVYTQLSSPLLTISAVASLVTLLALAERAHTRQARQLELERAAARTDALTGAPNRLALDEALVVEHGRVVRGARPAGVFIVDLDQFKRANDDHGHDAGDAILVQTVARLRGSLRDMDLVARWGGDELIVLAPEITDVDALEAFGERIKHVVSDTPFELSGGDLLHATASVGGTLLDGSTAPDVVLKRADLAVYRAKQTRNASVIELSAEARRGLEFAAAGGETV